MQHSNDPGFDYDDSAEELAALEEQFNQEEQARLDATAEQLPALYAKHCSNGYGQPVATYQGLRVLSVVRTSFERWTARPVRLYS